jgi:hypothetical protein
MFAILAHIRPLDLKTKQRVDVYVANTAGAAYQGLGGFIWESAITKRPRAVIELFALNLAAGVKAATADLEISLNAIKEVSTVGLYWAGAPIVMYRGDEMKWPAPEEFRGVVTTPVRDLTRDTLTLNCKVSSDALEKPLLASEFTGGGGIDGEPELRGTLKPAGFGSNPSVPLVMFDTVRNIGMIDGYGNLKAVDTLYEGGSSLGASMGDYPDYAALAAAIDAKTVVPGRWATCIASGLIGLGAPPVGVITADARFGYGMTGAMIRRILVVHASIDVASIETASLDALDVSVPYPIHYWTADQISVQQVLELAAAGCNATPIITLQNKIAIVRPFGGPIIGRFVRNGYSEPRVKAWATRDALPPTWQMKVRVARPVRVLTLDEINFEDTIVNRGVYSATEVYRAGNTVWTSDGAQWLYQNAKPEAGHAPPVSKAPDGTGQVSDDWWKRIKEPTMAQVANEVRADTPIVAGTSYSKGMTGTDQGARWIYSADIAWDGTMPPTLPAESNAFWTLFKDATTVSLRTNVTTLNVQADYQGKPNDGQLPLHGRGILTVGAATASDGVTWSVGTSGCDATIGTDGAFEVTAVRSAGYVDVKALYRGTTYVSRVIITVNNAAAPAPGTPDPGGGMAGTSITYFPSVTSTTYSTIPTPTAIVKTTGTSLHFEFMATYSISAGGNGKVARQTVLSGKIVYRLAGSAAGWTDVAEFTGTTANSGAFPDYESTDGEIGGVADLTGLVAATDYEFGILFRRTQTGTINPYGALTGKAT